MKTEKLSYRLFVAIAIAGKLRSGDTLQVTLRNEENEDGIYNLAKRLNDLFFRGHGFWPQQIALHPDHMAVLKKQGRTIDITVPEEVARRIGGRLDLADIPLRVPLVEDASLDLFTARATFTLSVDESREMAIDAVELLLKGRYGDPR